MPPRLCGGMHALLQSRPPRYLLQPSSLIRSPSKPRNSSKAGLPCSVWPDQKSNLHHGTWPYHVSTPLRAPSCAKAGGPHRCCRSRSPTFDLLWRRARQSSWPWSTATPSAMRTRRTPSLVRRRSATMHHACLSHDATRTWASSSCTRRASMVGSDDTRMSVMPRRTRGLTSNTISLSVGVGRSAVSGMMARSRP